MDDAVWSTGVQVASSDAASRKRPRSTSPAAVAPPSRRTAAPAASGGHPTTQELVQQLQDPDQFNQALNTLMQMTANHEINFTLDNDEALLQALVDLIQYEKGEDNHIDSLDDLIPVNAWKLITKRPRFPLSTLPRLHAVLVIFRNISFVAANLRPMTHELSVMALLIDCLYLDTSDLLVYSVFTLVNLAPVLDVTGHRLLADKLFLDTARELHTMGWGGLQVAKQLDDTHQVSVDKEVLWERTHQYVKQVWHMFAALHHVLVSPRTPRPVLMMAMEWMRELLEHHTPSADLPSMHDIFRDMPQDMMQKLVDCLWIPRLGPDSLDYVNPICNLVSRVSTLKLFMGYDATIDTELRDRALEVLQPLLAVGLSLPATPRLYNALVPCLTTKVGRNDAQVLANGIFKALGKIKEHRDGLHYVQGRLLVMASKDARIAQMALNHLFTEELN